ncbi:MAG: hypothetical protein PHG44_00605 [Lentisphaeria bacterium]|jgi:hypothetical protein|nr:hypothetical protein [Lentisphaeria bacterium]MDY0176478.1 hypothetical protein [Lentisphaeria bacterium]NLZ59634.1 hypothetical protein [Lentisphaerota bacterium]
MKKIFYALLLLLSLPLIFMLAIRLFALCMLIDIGFSPFSRSTPPAKANAEPAAISLVYGGGGKNSPQFLPAKEMLRRRQVSTQEPLYMLAELGAEGSFLKEPSESRRILNKIGRQRHKVWAKPIALPKDGSAWANSVSAQEQSTDAEDSPFVLWRELHVGKDRRLSINLILMNRGFQTTEKAVIVSQKIPEGWEPCLLRPEMHAYEVEKREVKWLISDASIDYYWPMQIMLIPAKGAEKLPLPEEMTQIRCVLDNGKPAQYTCQALP